MTSSSAQAAAQQGTAISSISQLKVCLGSSYCWPICGGVVEWVAGCSMPHAAKYSPYPSQPPQLVFCHSTNQRSVAWLFQAQLQAVVQQLDLTPSICRRTEDAYLQQVKLLAAPYTAKQYNTRIVCEHNHHGSG